jgi:RNA polymerase sigma-70 factor (ECF subfamily)
LPIIAAADSFSLLQRFAHDPHARYPARVQAQDSPGVPDATGAADDLGALLQRVAQQDQAAFARFYDLTSARVYGLALRIVLRRDLAEEVTSDAFFQVWRQAGRYEAARGSPLAWVLTIARSRALDALRRRDPAEPHADPTIMQTEAASADDPVELLSALDRHSALHEAIAGLAPQARQLLVLAFFRGLSHQEIATHTGMPLGTVKTVLRNALQSLQSRLAGALERVE